MNILVCKNYTITDHTKWYADRSSETGLEENYTAMEELCVASAKKYVTDLDEVVVFRGQADNIRDVFKTNFYEIYELWKQGHNILYVDLDVIFISAAEYFGKFNKLSMFNLTDPTSTTDAHYNIELPHFFNCGIRYYPHNMDQSVWDKGISMVENWNPNRWDCEQVIYNAMMFDQKLEINEVYRPHLAFQLLSGNIEDESNTNFNQIHISEAKAIHLHGSRSSSARLQAMEKLARLELPAKPLAEFLYL